MKITDDIWEKFDPVTYVEDNYSYIHDEDKEIIEILVNYYKKIPILKKSIEVGCGPNIYPLMLALSKVTSIDAIEYSQKNISYLKSQFNKLDKNWLTFWNYIVNLNSAINKIILPKVLKKKVVIIKGSIYNLPKNKYDLASMFFCAESITNEYKEFVKICVKFLDCVKPEGHAVATFMENSKGYSISDVKFPSVSIDSSDLEKIFINKINDLKIYRVPRAKKVLRPGYTGMLVLTGSRK